MIQLDVDLLYLTKHFNIGAKRISQSGDQSIEEIMKEEAANGNTAAANFDLEVLKDPAELAKVFKLSSPRNRYKILRNMSESDLIYLMQFLDQKDLMTGLQFFTKDKLLNLVQQLPKDKLATVVFSKFPVQKFLKMIPEKEMNKFFESTKIEKDQVMEAMQNISQDKLQIMMENYTGQPASDLDKQSILDTVQKLSPNKFHKAVQCMDKESKAKMIYSITQKNPDLLMEFSTEALMTPLKQLDKPELNKCLDVLQPEDLAKMLEELPQDLMSIVVTQIDPEVFSDVLCERFQDVLSEIAVA